MGTSLLEDAPNKCRQSIAELIVLPNDFVTESRWLWRGGQRNQHRFPLFWLHGGAGTDTGSGKSTRRSRAAPEAELLPRQVAGTICAKDGSSVPLPPPPPLPQIILGERAHRMSKLTRNARRRIKMATRRRKSRPQWGLSTFNSAPCQGLRIDQLPTLEGTTTPTEANTGASTRHKGRYSDRGQNVHTKPRKDA